MSTRTDSLRAELADLESRIKTAENAHQQARSTFSRFEGPVTHPMWTTLRDDVDRTLTHVRVLKALWHRTQAALLEQQNADHEA